MITDQLTGDRTRYDLTADDAASEAAKSLDAQNWETKKSWWRTYTSFKVNTFEWKGDRLDLKTKPLSFQA